jgi:8-amino-7-oxononanoate synthase
MLARSDVAIYVDAGTYPIARWGTERATGRGIAVREFAHHDAEALRRKIAADRKKRVLVATDGFCPGCGKAAPLSAYLDCARQSGGLLIVDDTQALGVFGRSLGRYAPYGYGGGGMLPRVQSLAAPDILVISSLAKAFGVPLAVLSGSGKAVEQFKNRSETRVHCSPPAVATVRAAEHALMVNRRSGDRLRLRLFRLVERFRLAVSSAGIRLTPGQFPVQTLAHASEVAMMRLHKRLLHRGVRTVLHRSPAEPDFRISFIITARHTPEAIERAAAVLAEESERAGDSTITHDNQELRDLLLCRERRPSLVTSQTLSNTKYWF